MPQVLGPAGNPPEATRNEVLLREAVDRLRAQLDAARQLRDAAWPVIRNPHLEDRVRRLHETALAFDKLTKELDSQ
jgi:hypothetical protein